MPFILIQGTFHLVGKTQAGNPAGFEPDGDSVQFKPANPQLLDRLTQLARPYRLTTIGSTQLRFEVRRRPRAPLGQHPPATAAGRPGTRLSSPASFT
jgi:hypothetical protein